MSKIVKEKPKIHRPDPKKALQHLRRAQELSDRFGGPTKGMTEEEVIASIKKFREEYWEAKFAAHSRR